MPENYCFVRIEWDIKAYHIFRIKPHPDLVLKVTHDINNQFDEHAMKVCCPDIQDIPHALLAEEAFRQRRSRCLVRDIAGCQVGRVPANLCRAFHMLLLRDYIESVSCKYTGNASVNPDIHARFQRTAPGQMDRPGGGADLSCNYAVKIKKTHFRAAMRIFEENVPRHELDNRFFV